MRYLVVLIAIIGCDEKPAVQIEPMCAVIDTQIRGRKCHRHVGSDFVKVYTLSNTIMYIHHTRVRWFGVQKDFAELRKPYGE